MSPLAPPPDPHGTVRNLLLEPCPIFLRGDRVRNTLVCTHRLKVLWHNDYCSILITMQKKATDNAPKRLYIG